jgi:hypothetical protein
MQIDTFMTEVAEAEHRMGAALEELAHRHADEADIFHLARTLARGCTEQLAALQPVAERYGARVADPKPSRAAGAIGTVRKAVSSVVADPGVAGTALLADLRRTYLAAHEAEILWATLLQGAKAARDRALIDLVEPAQAHAARCAKWLRTRTKQAAAQVLVAG